MIVGNNKPIRIIGYSESSMTQEFVNEISKTHVCTVVSPADFVTDMNTDYQHIVSVTVDFQERKKIIEFIDRNNIDLVTVIHDSVCRGSCPPAVIGAGSFVFPFCNLGIGARIGRHCIIGTFGLIGHYSQVGDNCVIRPGVMIVGKSQMGRDCVLNFKSSIINAVSVCDNIELMAFSAITKNIDRPGNYIGTPARQRR